MSPIESRLLPWVILTVLLTMTVFATLYVRQTSQLAERAAFDNAVQATHDSIQYRLDSYTDILTAASGLFVAHDSVERHEFRAFVQHVNLQQRYPGIQGVGLSLRIPADLLQPTLTRIRADGDQDFRVWPGGARPEYHPIVMLEPMDRRNRAAIGYDMFTDPVRRAAMERARDSGSAVASGRVTLVQEIEPDKQHGFLIYAPVYVTRSVPPSVRDRRTALYGFVYAPFRAQDLFGGIFGKQRREIGFEIYDDKVLPDTLLYRTDVLPAGTRPRFEDNVTVNVTGRSWPIRVFSLGRGFGAVLFPVMTFCGGIAVSVLLFALMRVEWRARSDAEKTAEKLRISESELQQASRAKDDFLAMLSHELRTPMTAIMGWSQLLFAPDLDEATHASAIDAIQKSSRAQAQLIDDLLDVSRITAGKLRIEPRAIDIGPVVRAAVETVVPAANAKGVRLDVQTPSGPVLVSGDGQRLQQVCWNLLTNSVKFTPRGGTVTVALRTSNHDAAIEVRDTGLGIDADFLPHVFERFRQADSSTSRAHSGLGLGLAIVRHLVELHGGEVFAESGGLGKGSTFRVVLPLLSIRTVTDEGGDAAPAVGDELRNTRILVVDDEEEARTYLSAVLRLNGADIRCAASAADALDLLQAWKPDLIVTDIGMPEVDGYRFLERVRASTDERLRTMPVIALTAYARLEDRQRALKAGFQAFVSKPVEPATLRAAIVDALAVSSE